jgi:hypothetical protein
MTPLDTAKALALAFVILAIEFLFSYVVVEFYAIFIDPGQTDAYYALAAVQWLVPWWLHIGGSLIFFFSGWLFTGRVRHRNAYAFIGAMCAWYLLIDFASTFFYGGFYSFFLSGAWAWMAVQFAAAFAGVFVARRTLPPAEQPTI